MIIIKEFYEIPSNYTGVIFITDNEQSITTFKGKFHCTEKCALEEIDRNSWWLLDNEITNETSILLVV